MTDQPIGYSWKAWGTSCTRSAWIVTAPNGTRVSFFEDGDVRVYRPDHDVELSTGKRAGAGTTVEIAFTPRP